MNSSFEEQLRQNGRLVYYNVGDSMMPLLCENRDLMVLTVPERPIKKYDAVLYKRENGQYVMHRIVGIKPNGYVLCGDNRYCREYGVRPEQVLALLTSVVRKGREISCDSFKYKLYVHLWCDFFYVRALILRVNDKLKKTKRKLKNAKQNH